ncbi:S66 family peptidase [Floricoccus penangensis]|uniref:S66 family peptidase n=1 Tax=Floricoccus penangensis TaxID=1859475 RepID=UPI00203A3A34|nr:S66 peptidase family protein [Floricoccus penangensis]URZ86717.1 LD-carboxypeptidase [Floricoccus penangensis]
MKSIAIVACSNPLSLSSKESNEKLFELLRNDGRNLLISKCIYEEKNGFSSSGKERAYELMKFFSNPDVTNIYDISGGDMANEILDYLDFEIIRKSQAVFWGYSDLTTVINAIYSQTGKSSVLYQIKNILHGEPDSLFKPKFEIIQGQGIEGTVVGGNIRCFLKLAGTKYFPDMNGKILLLESLGGRVPQMITYLSQLRSMGVFEKINGIILGTFTEMEKENCSPNMNELVQEFVGPNMPIAKTCEIGHARDSKAIWIGKEIEIRNE